ncbi:YeiH family protein [Pseudomonas sp. S9]|uniref:YeiH family protein n=1 Tax=Pseudomonas sp. S9 TaxID=686578 RepID=UPI0002556F82|nr:YeiH family protein [Pseudomonas sp. S9]
MRTLIALPVIAISALLLAQIPAISQLGLSALPLAIVLGAIYGHFNLAEPSAREKLFTRFCQQRLLRTGIILFGFSLSFQQIVQVGWQAVVLDITVTSSILILGTWLGIRLFGLPRDLAVLISAGSAICGAAAVLASEPVLKAKQQYVTIAVATVVLFGTLAMFIYPLVFHISGMTEHNFGIYIGSTIHEVAQAVAAGDSVGGEALQSAVVVKLIRVMLLAPFILILSTLVFRDEANPGQSKAKITVPWFVLGFIAAACINSWAALPVQVIHSLQLLSQLTLAMAMAALGSQTQWRVIKQAGFKPMLLAACLFVLLICGGFYLNSWLIPQ